MNTFASAPCKSFDSLLRYITSGLKGCPAAIVSPSLGYTIVTGSILNESFSDRESVMLQLASLLVSLSDIRYEFAQNECGPSIWHMNEANCTSMDCPGLKVSHIVSR